MTRTSPDPAHRHGPVDVLVTGAAGFIGAALVRRLESQGVTVVGVDVRAGDSPTVHMDVTDGGRVLDLFDRYKPRRVVHAAALVDDRADVESCQAVNVGGTQNILDAAAAEGVERVLHISSIAALGLDPGPECDAGTPLVFDTGAGYFDTKAASEELVREAFAAGRVPVVIVRPGDVFGPGSVPWVERPLQMMRRHVPVLVGGGRGLMAHCWIDNLVDGLVAALSVPGVEGRIFQITDGSSTTTYRDYFSRLARAADMAPPSASLPKPLAVGVGHAFDVASRVSGLRPPWTSAAARYLCRRATYSIDAARRDLDYTPKVGLDEAMEHLAPTIRERDPDTR